AASFLGDRVPRPIGRAARSAAHARRSARLGRPGSRRPALTAARTRDRAPPDDCAPLRDGAQSQRLPLLVRAAWTRNPLAALWLGSSARQRAVPAARPRRARRAFARSLAA